MKYSLVALFTILAVPSWTSANEGVKTTANVRREEEHASYSQEVVEYRLWKPLEIYKVLERWRIKYPDLINITSSQEKYGLPVAGTPKDCPFDDSSDGCPNYMFTIQDFVTHPEGSDSSNRLPEVFWSGCLHGNERVGPTSVMEAADLLLQAADCEAMPRSTVSPGETKGDYGDHAYQMETAKECRAALKKKGIDDVHRKWLARLVTTRRIVVVPTTNALGYFQNRRTENTIDPNRDFPYEQSPKKCMQTIAGRTANEIYREHMFQLALTFHGGMEVVAYEWGAPNWGEHRSPDDTAQKAIASSYSRFGGGWSNSKPYKHGAMNDVVYPVDGGMEDWAYAGSWDPERVKPCTPTTFDGYPKEKTVYNNSTLRVFNMLVETSDDKTPRKADLGTSLDMFSKKTKGNGHISRNIRLALLSADLVEPYVSIVGISDLAVHDDLLPLSSRSGRACQKTRQFAVAQNAKELQVQFTVGGAVAIDNVEVWVGKWADLPTDQVDCLSQPKSTDGFTKGTIVGETSGSGYFSIQGSHPRSESTTEIGGMTNGPVFTATVEIPAGVKKFDELVVMASARVDQDWKNQASDTQPQKPPQSHIVNARTDPDWHHESAGKIISGRLDWFSSPVTIVIGDFKDSVGIQGNKPVSTVDMNPRFGGPGQAGVTPDPVGESGGIGFGHILVGLLCLVACFGCYSGMTKKPAKSMQGMSRDDAFEFDSKPYSDGTGYQDDSESDDDEAKDGVEMPAV